MNKHPHLCIYVNVSLQFYQFIEAFHHSKKKRKTIRCKFPRIIHEIHKLVTFDLHLFMISINSFLPIPVNLKASAALKFGMLSYGCSVRNMKNKVKLQDILVNDHVHNAKDDFSYKL